jgi:hypothetical protein
MKAVKLVAAAGALLVSHVAFAQTATQTVTFQVDAINEVSVSTLTTSLAINSATAGSNPTSATSSGLTWAVTTNQNTAKITGILSADMPTGLTLSVNLAAPAGALSANSGNPVALSSASTDLVTGISTLAASGLSMTYKLDATAAAGVVASDTRTVTYTITGGT